MCYSYYNTRSLDCKQLLGKYRFCFYIWVCRSVGFPLLTGCRGGAPAPKRSAGGVGGGLERPDARGSARRFPIEKLLQNNTNSITTRKFSCTFRCAPRRFSTSRTTDKCCFSGICRPQQITSRYSMLSCCGGRPRDCRPPCLGLGASPPDPPCRGNSTAR